MRGATAPRMCRGSRPSPRSAPNTAPKVLPASTQPARGLTALGPGAQGRTPDPARGQAQIRIPGWPAPCVAASGVVVRSTWRCVWTPGRPTGRPCCVALSTLSGRVAPPVPLRARCAPDPGRSAPSTCTVGGAPSRGYSTARTMIITRATTMIRPTIPSPSIRFLLVCDLILVHFHARRPSGGHGRTPDTTDKRDRPVDQPCRRGGVMLRSLPRPDRRVSVHRPVAPAPSHPAGQPRSTRFGA